MIKQLIVYVDDEPRLIDTYIRELQFDYEVKHFDAVDKVLEFLVKTTKDIQLLILDVMMSPGNELSLGNTQNGLRTGLVLYEKIRKDNAQLPIIIFTNVTKDEQNEIVKKIEQDEKAKFLQKGDYLPFELSEEIQSFLRRLSSF